MRAMIKSLATVLLSLATLTAIIIPPAQAAASSQKTSSTGWLLESRVFDSRDYARQPYLGNGRLGIMVPATGHGYQGDMGPTGWPLYSPRNAGSFLAGFYAQDAKNEHIAGLPSWSTLELVVDGKHWNATVPAAQITNYRQTLDQRRALLTTSATWTPVPGKSIDLRYEIFLHRARENVGVVRLSFTPKWSGTINVTDLIDGRAVRRAKGEATGYVPRDDLIYVTVRADPGGKQASIVSTLSGSKNLRVHRQIAAAIPGDDATSKASAGQSWSVAVTKGKSYQITKFVGIASDDDGPDAQAIATKAARDARAAGWASLLAEHETAWRQLWQGDIEVEGNAVLQQQVRSALFGLYSSLRADQSWSIAPAGLSSDTYAGMIFWDAEIWMYPVFLAFHPDMAKSIVNQRYATLDQAKRNAVSVGRKGAVWPWSTGPSSQCNDDSPCKNYQDHLQNDIVLAQWQYYLATGDKAWLRERGWPVIKGVADFWRDRVRRDAKGNYHVDNVAGADEYAHKINDHAFTNAGAITALRIAERTAALVGEPADPAWSTIAANLVIPFDARHGVHAEYQGYAGQKIKQADTVLMVYPFEYPMAGKQALADLSYYAPLTDPEGPAMTDSVHAIITLQSGASEAQSWAYLQKAVAPFVRPPFMQFSESRGDKAGDNAGAPAYVFQTGSGGFLQIFLYGLTGHRWRDDRIVFAPKFLDPLGKKVTIRGLRHQGRLIDIVLGPHCSSLYVRQGDALKVETGAGVQTVRRGQSISTPTLREKPSNQRNCGKAPR